jgi:hypothetical protein
MAFELASAHQLKSGVYLATRAFDRLLSTDVLLECHDRHSITMGAWEGKRKGKETSEK